LSKYPSSSNPSTFESSVVEVRAHTHKHNYKPSFTTAQQAIYN
jgi:hypothetical protein